MERKRRSRPANQLRGDTAKSSEVADSTDRLEDVSSGRDPGSDSEVASKLAPENQVGTSVLAGVDSELNDPRNTRFGSTELDDTVTTQVEEKKHMSIFGDLDMDKVPDDPFAIDPTTYRAIVVEAGVKSKTVDEVTQQTLTIKYAIDEPDNDFHGDNVWDRYGIWPGVKWEDLTPAQKKTTKFLKQRLREGMDLTPEQIANFDEPADLVGKIVYLTIVQNEAKDGSRKFNNVRTAKSERLFKEEGGTDSDQNSATTGASVGLQTVDLDGKLVIERWPDGSCVEKGTSESV